MIRRIALALIAALAAVSPAFADVTVRNAAPSRIEVKVDSGSKTEVKSGDTAVFNTTKSEVTVSVFASGKEVASSVVKNKKAIKVTHANGVWTIAED